MGRRDSAKLQATRRNTGIYEVLTDDKDYIKVIADARQKLEKTLLLVCCAVRRMTAEGTSGNCNFKFVLVRNSQLQNIQEHAEK